MKEELNIYLFRHGKTNFNQKKIFTGWKESHLTLRGKLDAFRVARKLKNRQIDVAFQTRLSRSKETLKIVLKYHPECKKILEDNRMIERKYGILEGKSHKEFIKKVGERILNLKEEGDALVNLTPRERKKIKKFLGEKEYEAIHRGYDVKVQGGESFADVEKRVKKFIIYLKKYIKKNKVNVAISAHGNSIRLFRKIMENASKEEAIKWFIPYNKIFNYKIKV